MEPCDKWVRGPTTGLIRVCPGEVNASGICNRESYHLLKSKSGWCSAGAHEGTQPEVRGEPQRTCQDWQKCPCACHDIISTTLAPYKKQRVAIPHEWTSEEAAVVAWGRSYDDRQKLIKNPDFRVETICRKWAAGDKSEPCTAEYIRSQTLEEKPMTTGEIERTFANWLRDKKAFIGGEPQRFISFMKVKTDAE